MDPPALTSVVLPVRDAAGVLGEQLAALVRQTYDGAWEVVVAENGSRDASRRVAESFRDRIPNLRVIDASAMPGPTAARNAGAAAAHGEVLAFCDADDVVADDWLASMVRALRTHAFVAGAMDYAALNPEPVRSWGYPSHEAALPVAHRFLPFALSANMGIARRAFDAVGGFAEDIAIPAADDVDFSWRVQLAGFALHFEPRAVVHYRHRTSVKALWRQHARYGAGVPLLYRRFRDRGMPRGSILIGIYAALRLLVQLPMLLSRRRRGAWVRTAAHRWGMLRGAVSQRVLYF